MEQPKSITMEIDLRKLPMAFITNIKSAATGITKRVVCVPIEDNYIVEDGFVTNSGQQVRTAKLRVRAQVVSDEERAAYAEKYGKEKKQDWNLWLDMSKEAREALQERDFAVCSAANNDQIAFGNNANVGVPGKKKSNQ